MAALVLADPVKRSSKLTGGGCASGSLACKVRLGQVERTRTIQRQRRLEVPFPTVALVGYTNSGKSTLMNALTDAGVEVANRPFSTLDPTIRRLKLPGGMNVMLVDTVGFIHRLPHMLIDAFKATLEEVRTATMLLHVVDASSPLAAERMTIVDEVLQEIGAGAAPRIVVMNKADLRGARRESKRGA